MHGIFHHIQFIIKLTISHAFISFYVVPARKNMGKQVPFSEARFELVCTIKVFGFEYKAQTCLPL